MSRRAFRASLALVSTLTMFDLLAPFAHAQARGDWPQVRGPARDGVATEDPSLARTWTDQGPAERWRRPIGAGFAAPVVAGDRLFTLSAEDDTEHALCLDAATGKTLWQVPIGTRFTNSFGDGPRATPTVDGDIVYVVSGDAQLSALRIADGEVVWHRDLNEDFGGAVPRFGFSVSPLIEGDLLLMEVGAAGDQPAVVALDKHSGALRWGALAEAASYSSPVIASIDGIRQVIFSRRAGQEVVGIDLDGAVLWRHPGARAAIVIPMVIAPNRVFLSSSDDDYGGVMLEIGRDGDDNWQVAEVWRNARMRNHFNNAVIVGQYLYGFDNATLRCLDLADGSEQWAHRGFGKGSLIAASDRLYVLGDDGTLALVHATPERYEELGRVQAMTGRAWTAPALARGTIFVRDHDEIAAFDVSRVQTSEQASALIARHLESRGGDHWQAVDTLAVSGTYAAFSERAPFKLIRKRPDHFRLDFQMLGQPSIRAKDALGLWWQQPMLQIPAPARVASGPFIAQLEREAVLGPYLRDHEDRGLTIAAGGKDQVDGTRTLVLDVSQGDGPSERWHLDAETLLEVMIESTVYDMTQGIQPITQRSYYSDFRTVDGLVIPHRVEIEFGARLEVIEIDTVTVNPALVDDDFAMPASTDHESSNGS